MNSSSHASQVVPGIGSSDGPLLHGWNFSYFDTQASCLRTTSQELPISRLVCPFLNNNRNGTRRQTITKALSINGLTDLTLSNLLSLRKEAMKISLVTASKFPKALPYTIGTRRWPISAAGKSKESGQGVNLYAWWRRVNQDFEVHRTCPSLSTQGIRSSEG
jgi:hypothetical protein